MKTHCELRIRTKSGRMHSLEYNYNEHEIMKGKDLVQHILSMPYICVKEREGAKLIVPRDAIDSIELKGENI